MKPKRTVLVLTGVFATFCAAAWGRLEEGVPIPIKWTSEDARLSIPVDVSADRISIGELLDRIASKTQVAIQAGERDGSGDVELLVRSRNLTLAHCMECLWSLVSYRGAEWVWVRDGQPGSFTYTLRCPLRARAFPEALRTEMLARFVTEVETMVRLAKLSPSERKLRIRGVVRDLFDGDDKLANGYLAPHSDRMWAGLATMSDTLTPAQVKSVLFGDESIKVPVESLSDSSKAFVTSVWKQAGGLIVHRDGTASPTPAPTFLRFYAARSNPYKLVRFLLIDIEGQGAYAYAGGIPGERAARNRLRKRWIRDDETFDSKAAHGRFSVDRSTATLPSGQQVTNRLLNELAECSTFPLFARLMPNGFETATGGYQDPHGANITDWLNGPFDNFFQWKWRGNTMLAANPSWVYHYGAVIPWKVLSLLRQSQEPVTGQIPLGTLCDVASRVPWDQMATLRMQYPVLYNAVRFHDALATLGAKPLLFKRIRGQKGIPISEALPIIGHIADWDVVSVVKTKAIIAVRLSESSVGRGKQVSFDLLDSKSDVVDSCGFVDPGFSSEQLMKRTKVEDGN